MPWTRSAPQAKSGRMQAYLDYCQQVLGLREILWPPPGPDSDSVLSQVRILFIDEPGAATPTSSMTETSAPQDLLEKMIAAMKLPAEIVTTRTWSLPEIPEHIDWLENLPAVIVFSDSLAQFLSNNYPKMQVLKSPSPAEMLKNPSLKRDAWETMKLAMSKL